MSLQPLKYRIVALQGETVEGVLKRLPYRNDLGYLRLRNLSFKNCYKITIVCSFKIFLFCERVLRNLNDRKNNSVAQVKLVAFHTLQYL